MGEWTFPFVITALGLAGLAVGVALWNARRARDRFLAAFAADPEYQCSIVQFDGLCVTTTAAGQHMEAVEGRYANATWSIAVHGIAQRHSWFTMEPSMLGPLRSGGIATGLPLFDRDTVVRGFDEDDIRRALTEPAVQQAMAALFADAVPVRSLQFEGGVLTVVVGGPMAAQAARRTFSLVRTVADALDGVSNPVPRPVPVPGADEAVASSSGTPVGFRGR